MLGDRFVFDSEVLLALGPSGQAEVAGVSSVMREIDPPTISRPRSSGCWRVDGHTGKTPVSAISPYRDDWELSQARAPSVVRYMTQTRDIPADRLLAAGFGEPRPVDPAKPRGAGQEPRMELKFTEW